MKIGKQTIQFTLVRHAESTANVGASVGGNDVALTQVGHLQAGLLGEYFERTDSHFDAAWYSSLLRARLTFRILRSHLSIDRLAKKSVHRDRRLIERQHGEWEGREAKEVWTPTEVARMNQLGADYQTPGGESFRDVERRMSSWRDDALKAARLLEKQHVHFLVVSHGHALRCLFGPLFGISSQAYWRMAIENTSITRIRWIDDKGWFLDELNARPHLAM